VKSRYQLFCICSPRCRKVHMGLRTRIIIVVVLASSIINLFLCFYFIAQIRDLELKTLRDKIDKTTHMMKLVNARPIYNVDKETLKINMETFFDDENMKHISIDEADSGINITFERKFESSAEDIEKSFYIFYKGMNLGKMKVVYSTSLIEKKLTEFRTQMLFFTFAVIVIMVVVLGFIINRLMAPIARLAAAASEIAAGNIEKQIPRDGAGEVGILAKNFAFMQDAIKDKINDLDHINKNLISQIRQKEINEKKMLHQSSIIFSVNTFFQKSMTASSPREVAELFIPIAVAVIDSKYCFVGEVDKFHPEERLRILAISQQALADCALVDMERELRLKGTCLSGIRARVIRENTAIIANTPSTHPDISDMPAAHIPLDNFMGVPLGGGSKIKGIVAFSGKQTGYDEQDKEAAQMLAMALTEALALKHEEEEKLRLEEMMIQSEKMVSLGGLAAGMAHEINNPLAGILQNTQVIQNRLKNKLPANLETARDLGLDLDLMAAYMEKRDICKMIDAVLTAGRRAAAIVSNMLSFSRKSSSGFVAEDVATLLDQTLELAKSDYNLKKQFDFKKIVIERDYMPGLPKIFCKASEIQQVFFNILSNGAQAMMSGKMDREPCFTLRLFKSNGMVSVQIQDNGPGMSADQRKRIFEPFFTTKRVGEGTGLGLAVSYFIITENHKGRILVDSRPGEGSCFTITLPA
jgi:signal transduction histidine kinase/HAMP domain-containing protein